jgi:hypothetical protein
MNPVNIMTGGSAAGGKARTREGFRMHQASYSENGSYPDIFAELETYEKASERRKRYASLSKNVEKERQSVKTYIYEKVKAEYEEKMRAIEKDLSTQRELLQQKIRDIRARRSDLENLCRKDAERLEEIDFRTRVGEFTVEECRQERTEIEQRTQRQSSELARLEEIVGRCANAGLISKGPLPAPPATGPLEAAPEPQPEEERSDPARAQASEAEKVVASPEPNEAAAEAAEEAFEIVEEEPEGDSVKAPVVHCPLSDAGSQSSKVAGATKSRTVGPHGEVREYVTGYLVALEGSRKGERFPMISSNITLGSSPGIDIRMLDPGIANFHARVLYKDRKHFLENLDSMGRCYVNGVQATKAVELRDGDVIRLGEIKMQVEYASAQTTPVN